MNENLKYEFDEEKISDSEEANNKSEYSKKKFSNTLKEKSQIIKDRAKDSSINPKQNEDEEREQLIQGYNRGKVISVWGDNGITTLSSVIASELASKKQKQVLIISSDKIIPTNALWHINEPVKQDKSLALLLKCTEHSSSTLAKYLTVNEKTQPNIATLGYCDGDNLLTNSEIASYSTFVNIISSAQSIVDYVIIDCCKSISNLMTLAALELSDLQIFALTPDCRGLQFYKNNVHLLDNKRFNKSKRIYVANLLTHHNDGYVFEDIIGSPIVAKIPVDDGIRKGVALGELLKINKYIGFKYKNELNKIIKVLDEHEDEVKIQKKNK